MIWRENALKSLLMIARMSIHIAICYGSITLLVLKVSVCGCVVMSDR